jgi:hypothetical protein
MVRQRDCIVNSATDDLNLTDLNVFEVKKSVPLTSNEIKALLATPKQLVAAPGSGKVLVLTKALLRYTYLTAAYTGGGSLEFFLGSDKAAGFLNTVANNFLVAGSSQDCFMWMEGSVYDATATFPNKALMLGIAAAEGVDEFAAGSGTLEVIVFYSVLTL